MLVGNYKGNLQHGLLSLPLKGLRLNISLSAECRPFYLGLKGLRYGLGEYDFTTV